MDVIARSLKLHQEGCILREVMNHQFSLGLVFAKLQSVSGEARIMCVSPTLESLAACLTSCAIEDVHFRKLLDKCVVRQQYLFNGRSMTRFHTDNGGTVAGEIDSSKHLLFIALY